MEGRKMANIKSAKKRIKVNEKARERNRYYRSTLRTFIKKAKAAMEEGNKEMATQFYKKAISLADKMVIKSIIHRNKAARVKSRITKKFNAVFEA
jgi:small subunit ribosomal protein S20